MGGGQWGQFEILGSSQQSKNDRYVESLKFGIWLKRRVAGA